MQILLDVTQSAKGRLTGTAGPAADQDRLPFSGTMELVACVEKLCRADPATQKGQEDEKDNQ